MSPLSLAGAGTSSINEKDLYFREAFYYASQGNYVDAIARLDISLGRFYGPGKPNPDPVHFQLGNSRFSVGDFELSYRMSQRAERALKTIFVSKAEQSVRNEAAYRLARISLQKGEPKAALLGIERIAGNVPDDIREDELFLRAQIYMANGKFAEAVKALQKLQNTENYKGFAAYNLGAALIKTGQEKQGLEQLDKAGQISGDDEVVLSIRDKANLALGYRMLDAKQPALAKQYLDRVRLNGPYSNQALLSSGWAEVAMGRFDSAILPWSVLFKRDMTDQFVQEGMMGVPYAYAKLNSHDKAALLYGRALEGFEQELARLDASIKSVQEGKFLQALLHEESMQNDHLMAKQKSLPKKPETYYLHELMASNDFQESLKNYRDLDELLKRKKPWEQYLDAYEEISSQYHKTILPIIDKQFLVLEKKLRLGLEHRQNLDDNMAKMLLLSQSEMGKNLADSYARLQRMDGDVKNNIRIHKAFSRLRETSIQNIQKYDELINKLKKRVHDVMQKIDTLKARQGQILEIQAINELNQRRKHLQYYQTQARFALAESYGYASKMQSPASKVK